MSVVDDTLAPLQTTLSAGSVTDGVGLTVIVNIRGVPLQPFADGVTVIVATTGLPVEFVAVKAAISPVPLAAKPILGVLFVQLYTVPVTDEPLKFTAAVEIPLQRT